MRAFLKEFLVVRPGGLNPFPKYTIIAGCIYKPIFTLYGRGRGRNRRVNLPSPQILNQFFSPPYFKYSIKLFPHPGPSSSSYSQHFLFSLLPSFFTNSSLVPTFCWAISPSSVFWSSPLLRLWARNMSYSGCADPIAASNTNDLNESFLKIHQLPTLFGQAVWSLSFRKVIILQFVQYFRHFWSWRVSFNNYGVSPSSQLVWNSLAVQKNTVHCSFSDSSPWTRRIHWPVWA